MDSVPSVAVVNKPEEADISFAQKLLATLLFFVAMFVLPLLMWIPIWLGCMHPWGQVIGLCVQWLSRNAIVKCFSAVVLIIIFVTGPCLCGCPKYTSKRV